MHSVACIAGLTFVSFDALRILDPATIERATQRQSECTDLVIGAPMRYGLGFSSSTAVNLNSGPPACGHSSEGGSLGFAGSEPLV